MGAVGWCTVAGGWKWQEDLGFRTSILLDRSTAEKTGKDTDNPTCPDFFFFFKGLDMIVLDLVDKTPRRAVITQLTSVTWGCSSHHSRFNSGRHASLGAGTRKRSLTKSLN